MTATGSSSGQGDQTLAIRLILTTVIIVVCVGSATAFLIVILLHGGFNSSNMLGVSVMIGMITTGGIPGICQLILTGKLYQRVSNGLIPAKIKESLQDPENQAIISAAMTSPNDGSTTDADHENLRPENPGKPGNQ